MGVSFGSQSQSGVGTGVGANVGCEVGFGEAVG